MNIIAFLSILAFINETLMWLGHRVGLGTEGSDKPPLSFGVNTDKYFFQIFNRTQLQHLDVFLGSSKYVQ